MKFFGQHLLHKNVISRETLVKAVAEQARYNLRIGDYSVRKGYLSKEQVHFIHEEQKRKDKLFGEIAVELGYLSRAQVDELLTVQKNDHRFLGEILIEQGGIAREVLDRELKDFEESQKEYVADREYFPADVPYHRHYDVYVDLATKLLRRVANVLVKPETVARTQGRIGHGLTTLGVKFSGGLNGTFVMSLSEDKMQEVASSMLEKPASELSKELLLDAVKEFVNVVCGNVAARMAQMGKEIDIEPPDILSESGGEGIVAKPGETVWFCPLVVTSGELSCALALSAAKAGVPSASRPAARRKPKPKARPKAKPKAKPKPKRARKKITRPKPKPKSKARKRSGKPVRKARKSTRRAGKKR